MPGALAVGDKVVVSLKDGTKLSLAVVEVTEGLLRGTDTESGQIVQVPTSDIAEVKRQEFDVLKTVGLVAACLLLAVAYAHAAAASKLAGGI